ncbi:MAG: ribonucleoside-diphosphate reductase subunit alpha [Verrucomicrobia bacterium]|nr:ribonucleoside-diphosphate reductase subunit alpha [Verrucomicrobiota bacterium]
MFEEDLALKRFTATPKDERPRFNWSESLEKSDRVPLAGITLAGADCETEFRLGEVADTIGGALTDLLLSRHDEQNIFSDRNRRFVAILTNKVGETLHTNALRTNRDRITPDDVHLAIEKTLVEHGAYDVALSLVTKRSHRLQTGGSSSAVSVSLIRRNGQVVPWIESKIEIAVRRAFLSLYLDSEPSVEIAKSVSDRVKGLNQAFVHIEDVQDIVQEELMKAGQFKVAESYILYRARRSEMRMHEAEKRRDDEVVKQVSLITVDREDGTSYLWDGVDLKCRIEFSAIGLDIMMGARDIEDELRRSLFDTMTESDLRKTILLNAKALIEKDADFAKFAGRMLLSYIYEEVLDWNIVTDGIAGLKNAHRTAFRSYLQHGVEIGRLSPRLLEFDIDRLAEALDPLADLEFDYLGIQTLYDRYLIVDKTSGRSRRMETPQFFWIRVAMGLFIEEKADREDWVLKLYDLYKSRRFCSSTPTLFNSGTPHSQLSSCYLYKVDDSIESIMIRGIAENAFLSKWAGGLGGSWTAVRGTGSHIKGTNGESQGVIPFLKMHNDQLVAVNQGGKRRGSGCAYLETWHNDIFDFLELRRNTGDERRRTHDLNTANWIPDLFMKRMERRENWTLFRSCDAPDLHDLYGAAFEKRYLEYEALGREGKIHTRTVPAIELWKNMLKLLFETGHPWITFKDPCNVRSPQDHVGIIHSSNLCTEITLNTGADETAVCNLGSIVLDRHIGANGMIDRDNLRKTIRIAVRALDNVIDINFYPTEPARTSNMRHRPIGLGVMGLQNALYKKNLSFASDDAIEFNDEFMELVALYAYEASSDLAEERGTYSSFKGSKWDRGLMPQDTLALLDKERGIDVDVPRGARLDWEPLRKKIATHGMRNSNVLAIAPTATISNIMGTTPCIEPTYKNLFVKSNLSGDFIVLNQYLVRDLKARGLWGQDMIDNLKYFDGEMKDMEDVPDDLRKKYVTAFGIDHRFLIEAAARRQKWIDQAQSVNLFLGQPDLKSLSHLYRDAWRKGLKTTYYLRTLGASNIEKATVNVAKERRGVMADDATATDDPLTASIVEAPVFTEAEKKACSIQAMLNGEECEACQ